LLKQTSRNKIMTNIPVLTIDGKNKLLEELKFLKEVKREEIKKKIELAKEHGDLSENAEYNEAREEQSFTEGRILEIDTIIKTAVQASETNFSGITVGSKVTTISDGQQNEYTIVGSHESNPLAGLISCDSPFGQALLGHQTGEEVTVQLPKGSIVLKIIKVE